MDDLRLDVQRRELRVNGVVHPLGGRAFDILQTLVEGSGTTVSRAHLIGRVWPDVAVRDNALEVHISAIRKALGESRALLRTISGRGYRLAGDWTVQGSGDFRSASSPSGTQASSRTTPLSIVSEDGSRIPEPDRPTVFRLAECEVDLGRREIRVHGTRVPIGNRAFDIVALLVQSANAVVTRNQLLASIWSGAAVGDSAIDVQISAIRKALGSHRELLKTIPGRGYSLVGAWTAQNIENPPLLSPISGVRGSTNLPAAMNNLIGRAESFEYLHEACSAYRIVTLVGPGGIGKTALAIELARRLLPQFDAGVWLVDLTSLADPNLVPLAVAEAIGLQTAGGTVSAEAVARGIGQDRLLLVLDNCEHLIDAAAGLTDLIVRRSQHAVILATSRETLRIGGECIYRVPPLEVPQHGTVQANEVLGNSAVQLFLRRTEDLHMTGLRDEQNLRLIAMICRHLDGIPLAIEFAAARAASLGIPQLAGGLDDRFALLTTGRRTALPRHQTLRAVFDWSYTLLPGAERVLLHRLAVFTGGFGFDAVCAVMNDLPPAEVRDGIVNLIAKSIVTFDRSIQDGRWRLLETVRAYALDKLAASGEWQSVARRHAEHFRDFFATFDPNVGLERSASELGLYTREVDNLRAALAWAFSASGDAHLGSQLAAAAIHFWLATSLLDECCNWLSKALAELMGTGDDEHEMVLRSGLGQALMFTAGTTPAAHANLTQALSIAEAIGNVEHQKRALHGLWQMSLRSVELRKALQLGRRYAEFAHGDTDLAATRTANLMVGMSLTYLAEYVEASSLLERAIHEYPVAQHQGEMASLGLDGLTSAFGHLSTCLLARGLIDASIQAAERSIEEAVQIGQPVAVCLAMTRPAGLLFPEIGAFDTAEHYIAAILELADRHALSAFRALAGCAKGRMLFMRGDPASSAAALRSGLAQMEATGYRSLHTIFRGYFAEALTATGNADEGLAEAEAAVRFAEQTEYMRFVPELLCIHGNVLTHRQPDDPAAEQVFLRTIGLARQQQALYWELRAALGLAELWQTQGRRAEAHALLAPVRARFTEGLATPAITRANELLRASQADV